MRVQTIKKLSLLLNKEKIENVNLYFDSMDVNEYLTSMTRYNDILKNNACSILFVDPYNFGNVKIQLLKEFSNNFYSELIFNYFLSDFRRNINNQAAPKKIEKIKHSMEGVQGFNDEMSYEELLKLIQAEFKKSKICYSFAYQFYTKTNVPFYSIIYATPHHVGLEKIKESIWKIFEGQGYYRNNDKSELSEQLVLFDQKELNEKYYCDEAKNMILKVYRGKEVSYDEICIYLLENSLLKKGQIINGVLKPLVENKVIEKMNKNGKRNFSKDNFKIKDN